MYTKLKTCIPSVQSYVQNTPIMTCNGHLCLLTILYGTIYDTIINFNITTYSNIFWICKIEVLTQISLLILVVWQKHYYKPKNTTTLQNNIPLVMFFFFSKDKTRWVYEMWLCNISNQGQIHRKANTAIRQLYYLSVISLNPKSYK